MKLHRLLLEDFRGVDRRELLLPDAGVVVLEGANEIGKSSMLEALDMLLTEKHSSRKASVLATKPVHRDAPAQVEAEITSGPYRFTVRKQWHSRPATTLTVHEPRPEQFTGDEAHQRVQEILAETLDTGLWDALRLLQGGPLDASALSGSSALSAALDAAAGEVPDSPDGAETLLEAAAARAAEFFTPGGRPTGRLRSCTEEVQAARTAAVAAREALEAVADDAERHAQLTARRRTADEVCTGAQEAVTALEAEVAALASVRSRVGTAQAQFGLLERAAADAAAARTARERDVRDAVARAGRLVSAGARAGELRTARDAAVEAATEADTAALDTRTVADDARTAADHARDHVRRVEDVATLARLRTRRADLGTALEAARLAGEEVSARRVDGAALRRVEEADAAVRLAAARVESAAAHVVVEATAVEVLVDGTPVRAGTTAERTAVRPLEVDVAGFAVVRVVPGAEAGAFGDALAAARERLARELADVRCDDLTATRAAHEERRTAEAGLALAVHRLDHLAADGTADRLSAQIDALTVALGAAQDGDTSDPTHAREHEATTWAAERETRSAAVTADRRAAGARRALEAATHALAAHEAALEVATTEAALAVERVEAARERRSDQDVQAAAQATDEALRAARAELDAARAELAARDAEATVARAAAAAAQLTRTRRELVDLDRELSTVSARLEFTGREGRQETYDAALSAVERTTRDLDGLTRRAAAAKLLRDTLEAHRGVTRKRYVAPFTRRLESLGAAVFGEDFRVDLDDDLTIVSRTLAGRTVPYRELSTGAREQLAVLTRLACAALVDPVDGVPVVLDDALGHSDPDRLRRLGAVFSQVAPPAQVLLMAPGPGVHSCIPGATVIRLSDDQESRSSGHRDPRSVAATGSRPMECP